uniref:Putative lyase n=1 Tax=Oryza sativa subsp. japonica TaxID=39947 RepID=Q6UUE8_ORYSJ|nr:putative lyase [Oryza sativa Japonica Group]
MQKMRTVLIEHALANSEAERNVNTSVFAKVAMFEEKLRAALPREVEATRAAVENGTAAKANRITECKSYSLYRFVCKELRTEYLTGKKIDAVARSQCSRRSSARRCPGKWRLPRAAVENGTATKANRITECRSYSLYRFVRKELGIEYLTGEKIDAVTWRGCEQGVRRHEPGSGGRSEKPVFSGASMGR